MSVQLVEAQRIGPLAAPVLPSPFPGAPAPEPGRVTAIVGRWIEVVRQDEIAPGEGRTVTAGDHRLALFNDGGEFLAVDDSCPHQGASLGQGLLHEGRVICPLHSWIFDLRSGECPRGSHEPVATYPTRCIDGRVEVHMVSEPSGAETGA